MTTGRPARIGGAACVASLLLLSPAPLAADPTGDSAFYGGDQLHLAEGETHEGDWYVATGSLSLDGRQQGDLIVFAGDAAIQGEVEGDLVVLGGTVEIAGRIADATRLVGGTLVVRGVIEGDLLVFGGEVAIRDEARIAGSVYAFAGKTAVDGAVEGRLRAVGGQIAISGTVGRDVVLKADEVRIEPGARIGGDLVYTSRKELDLPSGIVAGDVRFERKVEDEPEGGDFAWHLFTRIGFALAALVVGLSALAIFRRTAPALVAPVAGEPLVGFVVGFFAFLVVPAASFLAMLLVIPLPLGVIALTLFLIALYLAKLPVALWLGQRLLRLVGLGVPSPYASLVLGLVLLYAVFALPCLGWLVWFTASLLGLGAMILAARSRLQAKSASPEPAAVRA
jgi:cytoskeletal protein CcmA (bactofilin family)